MLKLITHLITLMLMLVLILLFMLMLILKLKRCRGFDLDLVLIDAVGTDAMPILIIGCSDLMTLV